jgi:hypothetical protein
LSDQEAETMSAGRRDFLKASAIGAAGAALASCEQATSLLTQQAGQRVPERLESRTGIETDPDFHLLNRAAFGPWPGDLARLKAMGREAWIEEQLHPESLDDTLCDLRTGPFESLHFAPGNAYEFHKEVLRDEISRHTLLRAVYSRRQLFEVMVEFWTDHLNIDLEKGDCIYLKPSDDALVVRQHALGNFRDLIEASAKSPAMLAYLDGRDNKVRKDRPGEAPNENYARELLELHTLGVNGGYTQEDVREAARCLTGWTVELKRGLFKELNPFQPARGETYFKPCWHDDGEKRVLGTVISAGGGLSDLARLVEVVCAHPATADHLARKLCRRFVGPVPPAGLVEKTAETFRRTGGDIKSVLRVILGSAEFENSREALFKRPFRFVVSALRATGADTHAHKPLMDYLHRMGQGLFQHPTPDGYPDEETPWLGTLLWRWNFAFALAGGKVPTVAVNMAALRKALKNGGTPPEEGGFFAHACGRSPTPVEQEALGSLRDPAEVLGTVLASPAFQRC